MRIEPHTRVGPFIAGDRGRAELVVPVLGREGVDCLRFPLTRERLALLVADASRILRDMVLQQALEAASVEGESVGSAAALSAPTA